jgi:hypothetical protein
MLNTFLKIVCKTPVLMAGVFISAALFAQEPTKPNIHRLTSDKTAQKLGTNSGSEAPEQRIPGEIHKHSLGIAVGQTFLRSDLHDNGNDKITPEIYYNYSASYSFDFLANVHYSKHEYLNRSATIKGLALSIKGKGFQLDSFSPYVFGGLGFYLPEANRIVAGVPSETRSQLVFGVNAGAGVELRLNSQYLIGVLMHYHDPFDVRQDTGPKLEGSYLKLLLLVSYTFR